MGGPRVIAWHLLARFDEARFALLENLRLYVASHSPLSNVGRLSDGLGRSPSCRHALGAICSQGHRIEDIRTTRKLSSRKAGFCAMSANTNEGLGRLRQAVDKGYFVGPDTGSTARQFEALRNNPTFKVLLADAEAGRQQGAGGVSRCGWRPAGSSAGQSL